LTNVNPKKITLFPVPKSHRELLIAGFTDTGTAGPTRTIEIDGSSVSLLPSGTANIDSDER
jgi:hypothetical protein